MQIQETLKKEHPLDNIELAVFCKENKIPLEGVYMRNEKKPKIKKNKFYIFNNDDKDNSGTHWVAAFTSPKATIFFDPFGLPPSEEILKFLKTSKAEKHIYSSSQLQNIRSSLCGYYVLYFIYKMYKGKSLYDFLMNDKFSNDNTLTNDQFIRKIFKIKS